MYSVFASVQLISFPTRFILKPVFRNCASNSLRNRFSMLVMLLFIKSRYFSFEFLAMEIFHFVSSLLCRSKSVRFNNRNRNVLSVKYSIPPSCSPIYSSSTPVTLLNSLPCLSPCNNAPRLLPVNSRCLIVKFL